MLAITLRLRFATSSAVSLQEFSLIQSSFYRLHRYAVRSIIYDTPHSPGRSRLGPFTGGLRGHSQSAAVASAVQQVQGRNGKILQGTPGQDQLTRNGHH